MHIWHLTRTDEKAVGFVIIARTEAEARRLAQDASGEAPFWLDSPHVRCERIGVPRDASDPRIVLRSFNAG